MLSPTRNPAANYKKTGVKKNAGGLTKVRASQQHSLRAHLQDLKESLLRKCAEEAQCQAKLRTLGASPRQSQHTFQPNKTTSPTKKASPHQRRKSLKGDSAACEPTVRAKSKSKKTMNKAETLKPSQTQK